MSDLLTWPEEKRLYDERLERELDRQYERTPKCPVHGNAFIAGLGIGSNFYPAHPGGECPICLRERYGLNEATKQAEKVLGVKQ